MSTPNHDTELEEIKTLLAKLLLPTTMLNQQIAALNTYLYEQTLELIPEDFPNPPLGDFWNVGQNQLKAQLRKAAAERWGQE